MSPRFGMVRRMLVFLGGSGPNNLTAQILHVLSDREFLHLQVEVVIGCNHPDYNGIARLVCSRPLTTLSEALPTLAYSMAIADIMISGGGATTWERMCLGLPAVVIAIADNQFQISAVLSHAGYQKYLGTADEFSTAFFTEAVKSYLSRPETIQNQMIKSFDLTDGNGTARVCSLFLQKR